MICSKSKLEQELSKIRSILTSNGYPEDVITSTFQRKLKQLNAKLIHSADKCPVYLHVPWLGNVSTRFEKQISSAVKRCHFAVEPRVVFTTRQLLPPTKKDVLPSHHCSNHVYLFVCRCDSRYVNRTSQRLQERIKQHILKFTISTSRKSLLRRCKANNSPRQFHESAIGQHLLDNPVCASHYNDEKFSILARGCSLFHLSALEAILLLNLSNLSSANKKISFIL